MEFVIKFIGRFGDATCGRTNGCSTMTMRQPMPPSWLDGFWAITIWLWCHILPTRPKLHPATFSYFQNWKWNLRGEDLVRWRKFQQSRSSSCTRYEKMMSRNVSKTGSAAGIVVKPQNGTTLKVMPSPNVKVKPFCVLSNQSRNLLTTPRSVCSMQQTYLHTSCSTAGLIPSPSCSQWISYLAETSSTVSLAKSI